MTAPLRIGIDGPDPNLDSDGDGMPDWWEQKYFDSETGAAAGADPDEDGMSNIQECLAGTDPEDPDSAMDITVAEPGDAAQSGFVIRWHSASNRTYTLQAATNLANGFVMIAATNIAATPPLNVHTDLVDGVTARFYRIRLE